MAKSYIIKSDDPAIHMSDAIKYLASASYQGTFKGYALSVASSTGLSSKTYWYASKDEDNLVDRGLTGLLDYIDSRQVKEDSV